MSGSLDHSPAEIVQNLLVQLGLGSYPATLTGSWPIYVSNQPDKPDNSIAIYDTTGLTEGRVQRTGEKPEHHGFQIAVRATDAEAGWRKAKTIATALDETVKRDSVVVTDVVGTGTGTYHVYAVTRHSGPMAAGHEPGTIRQLFTINAVVALRQTS